MILIVDGERCVTEKQWEFCFARWATSYELVDFMWNFINFDQVNIAMASYLMITIITWCLHTNLSKKHLLLCCNNSPNSEYPQRASSSVPDGSRKLVVSGTLNFDFLVSKSFSTQLIYSFVDCFFAFGFCSF